MKFRVVATTEASEDANVTSRSKRVVVYALRAGSISK